MTAKVYLSGPMTGYAEHNFPAFHAAAARLREVFGFEVVNPAELDDPSLSHEDLAKVPHHVYLKRDIEVLLGCDFIYLLPGWKHSKGATLEAAVAKGCGLLEIRDPDVEVWRTFEGEPVIEAEVPCSDTVGPVPKLDGAVFRCAKSEGHDMPHDDGAGTWWEPPREDDLADRLRAEAAARADDLIRFQPVRRSGYQPGDEFPNVAYVRNMTGCTAAELAATVQSRALALGAGGGC